MACSSKLHSTHSAIYHSQQSNRTDIRRQALCMHILKAWNCTGIFCEAACMCRDCLNVQQYTTLVTETRQHIIDRSPNAFAPKVSLPQLLISFANFQEESLCLSLPSFHTGNTYVYAIRAEPARTPKTVVSKQNPGSSCLLNGIKQSLW